MFWAWLIFKLELHGVSKRITNGLLMIVGYGPLLCVINLSAYIAEITNPNLIWYKTEKISSKRTLYPRVEPAPFFDFDKALQKDYQREYRFFCRQLVSISLTCGIFFLLHVLKI
jgi:hypothetical protein